MQPAKLLVIQHQPKQFSGGDVPVLALVFAALNLAATVIHGLPVFAP